MTLIAGFKAYGIPILLGDFVLSRLRERSGLRKKIHKLGPNCAIAWTGGLNTAEQVFQELRKHFNGVAPVTRKELEDVLTRFKTLQHSSPVVLIGWLINDGQCCFRWRSDWPQEVFYPDTAYEGSGYQIVEKWCGPTGIRESSDPEKIDLDLAIDESLAIAANLMSTEILDNGNLSDLTFGHAYEILYADGGEFHYVDDILYFVLLFEFDEHGKVKESALAETIFKYRVLGECSVTEMYSQRHGGTTVNVISPVGINGTSLAIKWGQSLLQNYRFDPASSTYCAFLCFLSPGYQSPPFSLIQRSYTPAESRFIEVVDRTISYRFNDSTIENWYGLIRAQ